MQQEDVPEIALTVLFAAWESIAAVVTAAKKVMVLTLGVADGYVRGKKLKEII